MVLAAAVAIGVTPVAQARGLLGLFARDTIPAAPVRTVQAVPQPSGPTAPVAFISRLSGVAQPGVIRYAFVQAGQTIDLGPDGEIGLTYFSPCREERIAGGIVIVGKQRPETSLDARQQSRAASCRPLEDLPFNNEKQQRLPDEGPFHQQDWFEAVINGLPIFRWDSMPPGTVATLTVTDLDRAAPEVIWTAELPYPYAVYPDTAPPLTTGHPYLVTVDIPGVGAMQTRFSIDLDLSFTKMPLNALVWLRPSAVEDAP